jgi:intracellular sulfur oxidation DsrE/DsrF family protein
MNGKWLQSLMARRSFLSRLGLGVGVVGAAAVSGQAALAVDAPSATPEETFRPARHATDDWMDKIPGVHRIVFDCITPDAFANAMRFANNYYNTNDATYGVKSGDLAVLIIARHHATSFAYKDALWAKWGKDFVEQAEYTDPKNSQPPTANPYAQPAGGQSDVAGTMDALIKKGVQFGVCATASRGIAGRVAKATSGDQDAILKEIGDNLVPNARLVPAGIVAMSRAQEHGYTLVTPG